MLTQSHYREHKMFNLLSNQNHLIESLNALSEQELAQAQDNCKHLVSLLSVPAANLLANRKSHGNMLPQQCDNELVCDINSTSALLQNKDALIYQINQLCLTEAIVVRDTLDNCLELIASSAINAPLARQNSAIEQASTKEEPVKAISKNNVSPIRLGEIKQRLAQAVESDNSQKQAVKAKLNGLLKQEGDSFTRPLPKQA